jgi:hypothetical protein
MVAEVPETLTAACALFSACGYVQEAVLTDYVLHDVGWNFSSADAGRFVFPATIDDLDANDLLPPSPVASARQVHPQVCWERSVETLTARKDDIAGLAVASDERIEACVLFVDRGDGQTEILSLRSFIEDGEAGLAQLLSHLRAQEPGTLRFPKVHPAEISQEFLETLGFRPTGVHRSFAGRARSE